MKVKILRSAGRKLLKHLAGDDAEIAAKLVESREPVELPVEVAQGALDAGIAEVVNDKAKTASTAKAAKAPAEPVNVQLTRARRDPEFREQEAEAEAEAEAKAEAAERGGRDTIKGVPKTQPAAAAKK